MGNLHSRIPTRGTSSQPMPVTVVGGGTSGTEYTDGQAVPANPTAPSLVYDNSGNWQHVSAANPLPVTGGGGGQQYTSGATVPATQIGNALEWSDGVNWQTTSTAKPLPVTIPASSPIAVSLASYQTTIPVSLASLPVPVSGSFFQTIQPVSLASILVPVSLASLPVPVSGAFFQATQPVSLTSLPVPVSLASLPVPVSGTFWQTTQPMSLSSILVPISLASVPVPVSGTFFQTTQPVSLTSVPVPISGTVTANQGTANATPWNIEITDGTNTANVLKSDGSSSGQNALMIAPTGQTAAYSTSASGGQTAYNVEGYSSVAVDIKTNLTGGSTIFEVSNDNVNWRNLQLTATDATDFAHAPGATGMMYSGSLQGVKYFRLDLTGAGSTASGTVHFSSLPPFSPTNQYVRNGNDGVSVQTSTVIQPVVNYQSIFNGASFDTVRAGAQTGSLQVGGAVATNSNVSSANHPLIVAGSDYGGTAKIQSLKVDATGNAQVNISQVAGVSTANTFDANGGWNVRPNGDTTVLADAKTNQPSNLQANSGNGMALVVYPYVFNGTTWDRTKGDATNGIYVQSKTSELATVSDPDQSYTPNTTAALTIATNGRLRVENDRTNLRLDELNYIQNYITDINTIIASESENSQRAGFEMR